MSLQITEGPVATTSASKTKPINKIVDQQRVITIESSIQDKSLFSYSRHSICICLSLEYINLRTFKEVSKQINLNFFIQVIILPRSMDILQAQYECFIIEFQRSIYSGFKANKHKEQQLRNYFQAIKILCLKSYFIKSNYLPRFSSERQNNYEQVCLFTSQISLKNAIYNFRQTLLQNEKCWIFDNFSVQKQSLQKTEFDSLAYGVIWGLNVATDQFYGQMKNQEQKSLKDVDDGNVILKSKRQEQLF